MITENVASSQPAYDSAVGLLYSKKTSLRSKARSLEAVTDKHDRARLQVARVLGFDSEQIKRSPLEALALTAWDAVLEAAQEWEAAYDLLVVSRISDKRLLDAVNLAEDAEKRASAAMAAFQREAVDMMIDASPLSVVR